MVSKKKLIKNLSDYSPAQVADAIRAGVVTMYELSESGKLTPLMRKNIEDALNTPISQTTWNLEKREKEEEMKATLKPSTPAIEDPDPSSISDEKLVPYNENVKEERVNDNPSFTNRGMFRRPFSFKGRIRRLEFGISFIISYVLCLIWDVIFREVVEQAAYGYIPSGIVILLYLVYIPIFWFTIAQGCKRCHDRDSSGWWQLLPFYVLVMLFGDSEPGSNEYGDNPKGK